METKIVEIRVRPKTIFSSIVIAAVLNVSTGIMIGQVKRVLTIIKERDLDTKVKSKLPV